MRCKMVVPADSWIPDETLMLEISNLRAHCPHAWRRAASGTSTLDHRGFGHRSCGMIVRYEDLKSHAQVCDFKTVICGLVEKERDVDMPSRCDVECVARDLEAHRRECAYRVWPCPNEGCDWTGSAMHAASHAETCAFKPVVCAHGCGATLRSASVVERHEEICPAKEVVCGLVDEDDPDASRNFATRFFGVKIDDVVAVGEDLELDTWKDKRSTPPAPAADAAESFSRSSSFSFVSAPLMTVSVAIFFFRDASEAAAAAAAAADDIVARSRPRRRVR